MPPPHPHLGQFPKPKDSRLLRGWNALVLLAVVAFSILPLIAQDSLWIRPQTAKDPLLWGRRDGLVFGLPSTGGMPGPRGLIRVGTVDAASRQPKLLNFIAIEPVTEGKKARGDRMAFSELEKSRLDHGIAGARLWVGDNGSGGDSLRGTLVKQRRGAENVEVLSVRIEIEAFPQNHAHVYLILSIQSDHPNELHLSAYPYPDSRPLDEVVFTATMGAYERLRYLWLKGAVVDSRKLYAGYTGGDFAEHDEYPLQTMLRDADGSPIVLATPSEREPSAGRNPNAKPGWYYPGPRLTQYWKVPPTDVELNLRVRVNGRHTYWKSKDAIPDGTTFENFELRQKFKAGQTFVFGVTQREPDAWIPPLADLGPAAPLN